MEDTIEDTMAQRTQARDDCAGAIAPTERALWGIDISPASGTPRDDADHRAAGTLGIDARGADSFVIPPPRRRGGLLCNPSPA
jgi:hypothetical protein